MISRLVKKNRAALELELQRGGRRRLFSPALMALERALIPRILAHARGRFLDLGCGTMPFRDYAEPQVRFYESLDVEKRVPEVNYEMDAHDLTALGENIYDVVLCSEVLEHVPDPGKVLEEVWKVLVPEGKLLLTVPFLSWLHEEPHDYFRFTRHGLRQLLFGAGFRILEITPTASLLSFLGHQLSTILVCGVWHVPVLKHLALWCNALAVTLPCYYLDRLVGTSELFPLGYVLVAEKEGGRQQAGLDPSTQFSGSHPESN